MSFTHFLRLPGLVRLGALAVFALLAGCEGEVTMDLATEQPSDPNITQVVAPLRGLEFTTSSGGTETLEFNDPQLIDFMDLSTDSGVLRLFSSETLPEGNYTGVRLLFDEDDEDNTYVSVLGTTADFQMFTAQGDYAPISFNVEDRKSNRESFTLVMDLRQSLTFDDGDDEYTLTPILRAVKSDEASRIQGTVNITCPGGSSLTRGAVYLFQGRDVVPDDIDNANAEPFATSPLFSNGGAFAYALRYLPEGDYTLSLSCFGDDDDPLSNDDLDFRNTRNIDLGSQETQTENLP